MINTKYLFLVIAGVMFVPYYETKDGFEEQWSVNYLSHFLLTSLLLPLLKTGGQPDDCSRIINITSCAYTLGVINFNDINCKYVKRFCSFLICCLMLIYYRIIIFVIFILYQGQLYNARKLCTE